MVTESRIEIRVSAFAPHWQDNTGIDMDLKNKVAGGPPNIATDGVVTTTGEYQINLKHTKIPGNSWDIIMWATTSRNNVQPTEKYKLRGVVFKKGRGAANTPITSEVRRVAPDPANPALLEDCVIVNIAKTAYGAGKLDDYEFKLVVERLSDNEIGLIDPDWENED
jgi:hypothetical protein